MDEAKKKQIRRRLNEQDGSPTQFKRIFDELVSRSLDERGSGDRYDVGSARQFGGNVSAAHDRAYAGMPQYLAYFDDPEHPERSADHSLTFEQLERKVFEAMNPPRAALTPSRVATKPQGVPAIVPPPPAEAGAGTTGSSTPNV
ncbi:MAG: hypothetical protein QM723_07070 [Myxococcaceae bacterium]